MTAPITDEELAQLEDGIAHGLGVCNAHVPQMIARIRQEQARAKKAEEERDEARALASDLADLVETSRRWYHDSTEWESGDNETGPLWQAIWNRFTWAASERAEAALRIHTTATGEIERTQAEYVTGQLTAAREREARLAHLLREAIHPDGPIRNYYGEGIDEYVALVRKHLDECYALLAEVAPKEETP